jgi:hypothetical protein
MVTPDTRRHRSIIEYAASKIQQSSRSIPSFPVSPWAWIPLSAIERIDENRQINK